MQPHTDEEGEASAILADLSNNVDFSLSMLTLTGSQGDSFIHVIEGTDDKSLPCGKMGCDHSLVG